MPQLTGALSEAGARIDSTGAKPASLPLWAWLVLPVATALTLAVLGQAAPEFYREYMIPETGVLEMLHVIEGAAGAVLAAMILTRPEVRRHRWLAGWGALALAGCAYVAGEEASWGQHIFVWATPEGWQAMNDQGETNLHNVSSWFDQKPRLLLELGVITGGLVLPFVQRLRGWPRVGSRIDYIMPPITCLPAALMAESVRLEEAGAWLIGAPDSLFYRGSEVQELFFYYFVILYLIELRRRVRGEAPPA